MLNAFNKKKHLLEDEDAPPEPFDPRIKQIEAIRKNRLMQLEKAKQEAQKILDEQSKILNNKRKDIIQKALYFSLFEPVVEKKLLLLNVSAAGLGQWMDEVKLLRQHTVATYGTHGEHTQEWLGYKASFDEAKQACHAMLIQTEKLALLETLWNESGGSI